MLYQICYASIFRPTREEILKQMHEISERSRTYTFQHDITGRLCFGDGKLFECLEGSEDALKILMQKIEADDRHEQIHHFGMKKITERRFKDWNIHFIAKRSQIYTFCHAMGLEQFEPSHFSVDHIEDFIVLLSDMSQ